MPSITKEQVKKINAECSNGWSFDLFYFFTHSGEKTLLKEIKTGADTHITAKLWYSSRWNRKENCNEIFPQLHLMEFHEKGNGVSVGFGLGKFIPIGEKVPRRNFKLLQNCTKNLTEAVLLELYHGAELETCGGLVQPFPAT